jgi:hypothetical protein
MFKSSKDFLVQIFPLYSFVSLQGQRTIAVGKNRKERKKEERKKHAKCRNLFPFPFKA